MTGFSDLLNDPSVASFASATDQVSSVARASTPGALLNPNGQSAAQERLYLSRPRSAGVSTDSTSSLRGSHAYIKLLTTSGNYRNYVAGATSTTVSTQGAGNGADPSTTNSTQYSTGSRKISYPELVGSGGDVTAMSDVSGNNTHGYDKFLLTSVSTSMTEKTQIVEVFGDNEVVYYFGRQPMIFNISGVLVDSPDNNWFVNWLKLYSDFLRGSKLAENYELLSLVLPNMIITGSITGFSWNQDAARDVDIPFSFQFIAKTVEPISAENIYIPSTNNLSYVDFSQVASFTGQAQINTLKNQASQLTGIISNPTSSIAMKASAFSNLGQTTGGAFGSMLANAGGTISGFQGTVNSWNTSQSQFFAGVKSSSMFQSVTSSLTGIRMNLFSPIYGVLASLTKLVMNTTNSVASLLSSVISPVRSIINDITNIANQATSLVNLVNSSISGLGRYVTGSLKGLSGDFDTAIKSLGKATGAIGAAPLTAAQSVIGLFASSTMVASAPFLSTSSKVVFARPVLPAGSASPPTKASLLISVTPYTPAKASL